MKIKDCVLAENPIDAVLRVNKSFLPQSIKVYLVFSNHRPSGLILSSCISPLKPWPWNHHSDAEWRAAFNHNSGTFISVFLRLDTLSNKLLPIIEPVEIEYQAALKRLVGLIE